MDAEAIAIVDDNLSIGTNWCDVDSEEFRESVFVDDEADFDFNNSSIADDVSGTTSPKFFPLLSYYLSGPLLLCLVVFGLTGNVLCLYVLSRPKRRPRVNVYLLTLAGWDWVLVASSFFVYNVPALVGGEGTSVWEWSFYVRALPFLYAVAAMAHSCSIWIVVCLGVERYFALCHPLKHRLFWSGGWLRKTLLAAISASGVLYSLPRLFETRIEQCINRDTGTALLIIGGSALQNNVYYRLWYKTIGGMLLFSVGPIVSLLIVSIRVAAAMNSRAVALERRLACSVRRRSKSKSAKSIKTEPRTEYRTSDARVTVDSPYNTNTMLIVVVIKFLFCHSLPAVLDVLESTMGSEFHNNTLIDTLIDISNTLVVMNSSCNIVIYYSCSRRFRYELFHRLGILTRKLTLLIRTKNSGKISLGKGDIEGGGNAKNVIKLP